MAWNYTKTEEIEELTKNEYVDPDMALLAYNWNHQRGNYYYQINIGLLERMAKRANDGEMDVYKLVSKDKKSRYDEMQRVLGNEDYEEYMRNYDLKGFWRKFFFNVRRNGRTQKEIRKEKAEKMVGKR